MMNLRQKENHVFRVRRSFEHRETEIKIVTTRTANYELQITNYVQISKCFRNLEFVIRNSSQTPQAILCWQCVSCGQT